MKVLIAGHCSYDSANLSHLLAQVAEVETVIARSPSETLAALSHTPIQLVLLNRVYEDGRESGLELIPQIKQLSPTTEIMLISNFPEAQAEAIAAGALPGFGKRAFAAAETRERLQRGLKINAPIASDQSPA